MEKIIYPRINIKHARLQHSRLNHLAPIGIGTPYVESITGYMVRLAESHNWSPGILFRWEMGPTVGKSYLFKMRDSEVRINKLSTANYTMSANGIGTIAEDWVRSLEELTMCDRLQFLTMLTWRNIISSRELFRPVRAWCPDCYDMWRAGGQVIYEPLMWKLLIVNTCYLHQRSLRTICQECKRQLHVISGSARPGHCDYCRIWLGTSPEMRLIEKEDLDEEEASWQAWVSNAVGEMFTAAPTLVKQPDEKVISRVISRYFEQRATRTVCARQLDISFSTLGHWAEGRYKPTLSNLLKFWRYKKVSPIQFINSSLNTTQPANKIGCTGANEVPRRKVRLTYEEIQRVLKAVLKEYPPPPMKEVVKRVEYHAVTLRKNFNNLYKSILSNYKAYVEEQRRKAENYMQQVLQDGLNEDPPPRVPELVKRAEVIGERSCRQRFPGLCSAISARYKTWLQKRLEQLRKGLEDALNHDPPLTVKDVARHLSCEKWTLRLRFPGLCHAIAVRFAQYRAAQRVQKEKAFRAELRQVALMLISRGLYPSLKRVGENLRIYKVLTRDIIALDELRRFRSELGIGPKNIQVP